MTEVINSKKLSGMSPWPVHSPTQGELPMSSLNRRLILAGAAAAPIAAVAGKAAAAAMPVRGDPIFAAIEAHRCAWDELCKNCSRLDREDTEQSKREFNQLNEAIEEASDGLLDVLPTTIAGVSALLTYAADNACGGRFWPQGYVDENPKTGWDRENGVSWEVMLHRNLAKVLPKIAPETA
jgi:hypothetical protein